MNNVNNLNDIIHAKIRLGIISLLMTYGKCDFTFLKESLAVTDGNLGSHLKKLEGAGYVEISKTFVLKKPKTYIEITNLGVDAYREYISVIEDIIKNSR